MLLCERAEYEEPSGSPFTTYFSVSVVEDCGEALEVSMPGRDETEVVLILRRGWALVAEGAIGLQDVKHLRSQRWALGLDPIRAAHSWIGAAIAAAADIGARSTAGQVGVQPLAGASKDRRQPRDKEHHGPTLGEAVHHAQQFLMVTRPTASPPASRVVASETGGDATFGVS